MHILQNKKDCLEKVLHDYDGVKLHSNHFLITGAREKLIQTLIGMYARESKE